MKRPGFILKALSEKGQEGLRKLVKEELRNDKQSKHTVTCEDPYTIKCEILDFRVKVALKAGAVNLESATQQMMVVFDQDLIRGVDYEVEQFR